MRSSTQLRQTPHTRLPVYDGALDNLVGLLLMKPARRRSWCAAPSSRERRLIEVARGREA